MRYLGLDVGQRRIGLAVGEVIAKELSTLTAPKETKFYEPRGRDWAVGQLREIVKNESIDALVVGQPVNEQGQATHESRLIKEFADYLGQSLDLKVHFTNETLTSFMAADILEGEGLSKDKAELRIDQLSAQLILQQYLEDNAGS